MVQLALARHVATGKRIGVLMVNPGGPGASAVNFVGGGVDPALLPRLTSSPLILRAWAEAIR